ncbi:MAG: maltose ABC transporter substrate-binding protein [Anaerolineae bacterium]|nr:maltose ABC transporter substrate-binding protein [Anaerolineae bacterium]
MKRLLPLVLAVTLIMGMFAMGSGNGPVTAQDNTATPAPTATFLPSTEGTLVVWVNAEREAIVKAAGEKFQAKYGIPVVTQTMGFGDVRNNFNIAAPAGEGPDLIVGAHDWIGQLYSNGLLEGLDLGDNAKNFDPQAISAFTYDGKLVGVPYQVEAIGLYYNKDLVPEPPKTFAEAVEISKKLVADGKVDQGIAIPQDSYHTYPIFSSYGGYIFGKDKDGNLNPEDVGVDSPGFIKGAEELDKLVKDKVFNSAVNYGEASDLFKKGRLAMWVTGPWELNNMRASGINYGVAKIPAFDGPARPFLGVQGFMVSKYAKNLDLAKAFATEFIATQEVMQALYDAAPAVSAFLPVREANPDKDLAGFAESIADGEPMPAIPAMSAVWNSWGNAVTLIYQQKEAPDKAMKDAAEAIRAEIAKSK